MKRLLITIFTLGLWTFYLQAQSGEFDPANPGDPNPFYSLTVQVSPSAGGTVNVEHTMLEPGKQVSLRITSNANFQFQQWVCGEEVLSSNTSFKYTMPARNVVITAQMMYVPQEFNPASPADPEAQEPIVKKHHVTIFTSPSVGGTVNVSSFDLAEGKKRSIYAYNNAGYEFIGWASEGNVFSQRNPMIVQMGKTDLTYTAVFAFNPVSPADPGVNHFNGSTGLLIVDNFVSGRLTDAITNVMGSDYSVVKQCIIKGELSSSDLGVFRKMTNCENMDLSRTSGFTSIPAWTFQNLSKLSSISLPITVETIANNAFYGCSQLADYTIYAIAPPVLQGNLPVSGESVMVRVPATSLSLYQAADRWNTCTLVPMDACSLTVGLPSDAADGRYTNMSVEIENTKTHIQQRYIITDKMQYVFHNLFVEDEYIVSVKNNRNLVLGSIRVDHLTEKDNTIVFGTLLQPQSATIHVLMPDGKEATSLTSIVWKDTLGNYLATGQTIANLLEGVALTYTISLSNELKDFQQPQPNRRWIVKADNNAINYSLEPIEMVEYKGVVLTNTTSVPVADINVSVSQDNQGGSKSVYVAKTNKEGRFSIIMRKLPGEAYFTANDYLKNVRNIDTTLLMETDTIRMQPLTGAQVYLLPRYTESVALNETPDTVTYSDYSNLDYAVYNHTRDKALNNFSVKYPLITIADKITLGDSIVVTVSSRKRAFNPVKVGGRVDSTLYMSLEIPIVQKGGITASYVTTSADEVIALLYNSNGELANYMLYDAAQTAKFELLDDGDYTLVTMESVPPFNALSKISMLQTVTLQEGEHYKKHAVHVRSGVITIVEVDNVPLMDKSSLYAGDEMKFYATQSSCILGEYVTIKGQLDFKKQYEKSISNMQYVVELPENTELVANSVLINNRKVNYTLDGKQLRISVPKTRQSIAFCIMPKDEGEYSLSGMAQFTMQNEQFVIPAGSAHYSVKGLTIEVPATTRKPTLFISGTAMPKSDIEVYADGVMVGSAKTAGNGIWTAECTLQNPVNLSSILFHATSTVAGDKTYVSEAKTSVYDKDAVEVSKVTMSHYNSYTRRTYKVVYDFQNPQNKPAKYDYYVDKKFWFEIDFTENDTARISDVILYVKTAKGMWVELPATFNEQKGKWEAEGEFNKNKEYDLPTNVAVDYQTRIVHKLDSKAVTDALQLFEELKSQFLSDDDDGTIDPYEDLPQEDYSAWLDSLNSLTEEEFDEWALKWEQEVDELTQEMEAINQRLDDEMSALSFFREDTICLGDAKECIIYRVLPASTYSASALEKEGFRKIPNTLDEQIYEKADSVSYIRVDFARGYAQIMSLYTPPQPHNNLRKKYGDPHYMENFWPSMGQQAIQEMVGQAIEQGGGRLMMTPKELEKFNKFGDKIARNKMLMEWGEHPFTLPQLKKYTEKNQKMWKRHNEKMGSVRGKLLEKGAKAAKAFGTGFAVGSFIADNYGKYSSLGNVPHPSCSKEEFANRIAGWEREKESIQKELNTHAAWQAGRNLAYIGLAFVPGVGLAVGLVLAAAEVFVESHFEDQFNAEFEEKVNRLAAQSRKITRDCAGDGDKQTKVPNGSQSGQQDSKYSLDPSGYVYEGVEENRVEGVKATIYYKDSVVNEFGEKYEGEVIWDASEFDQENPLYTDEFGMYQWFVPQGLWQVRFEKDGYEPTQSEWLPVPPPQLEVNIPIVQLRQPEVQSAVARKDAIDITFDKYMQPELLNTENVLVTANNQQIAGTVALLDEQYAYGEEGVKYATKVRFVPSSEFSAKQIMLTVSNRVRSYADVPMAQTFQQVFDVENVSSVEKAQKPVPSITSGSIVTYGTELTLTCATEGAVIRYTIDGTQPDCTRGFVYNGTPIILSGHDGVTINTIACADGYDASEIVSLQYLFGTTTDTETANQTSVHAVKLLEKGNLYIVLPDGRKYTIYGAKVR